MWSAELESGKSSGNRAVDPRVGRFGSLESRARPRCVFLSETQIVVVVFDQRPASCSFLGDGCVLFEGGGLWGSMVGKFCESVTVGSGMEISEFSGQRLFGRRSLVGSSIYKAEFLERVVVRA